MVTTQTVGEVESFSMHVAAAAPKRSGPAHDGKLYSATKETKATLGAKEKLSGK